MALLAKIRNKMVLIAKKNKGVVTPCSKLRPSIFFNDDSWFLLYGRPEPSYDPEQPTYLFSSPSYRPTSPSYSPTDPTTWGFPPQDVTYAEWFSDTYRKMLEQRKKNRYAYQFCKKQHDAWLAATLKELVDERARNGMCMYWNRAFVAHSCVGACVCCKMSIEL